MSTRSRIAVKLDDSNIKSIYCHWDGYPSNNGKMLLNNYNSKSLALNLIMLGDLSSLQESADKPEGHSFDKPIEGFTIAYGRDRGEKGIEAIDHDNVNDLIKAADDSDGEYTYMFDCKKNKWFYLKTSVARNNLRLGINAKPIKWYALNNKNTAEK
jgi:hypothetical protein